MIKYLWIWFRRGEELFYFLCGNLLESYAWVRILKSCQSFIGQCCDMIYVTYIEKSTSNFILLLQTFNPWQILSILKQLKCQMYSQRIIPPNHFLSPLRPLAPIFAKFLKHFLDRIPTKHFNKFRDRQPSNKIIISNSFLNNSFIFQIRKCTIMPNSKIVRNGLIVDSETISWVNCIIVIFLCDPVLIQC